MTAAVVFDAYGTLLDVDAPCRAQSARLGPGWPSFSNLWRAKLLEYSWVEILAGRYVSFEALGERALDYALEAYGSEDSELRHALLSGYASLPLYVDAMPALDRLAASHRRLLILTNAAEGVARQALAGNGMENRFEVVLSAERIGRYKPDPALYAMVSEYLGVPPRDTVYVSANAWDIAGAGSYGFRTAWINRRGVPREYPFTPPAFVLASLAGLPDRL